MVAKGLLKFMLFASLPLLFTAVYKFYELSSRLPIPTDPPSSTNVSLPAECYNPARDTCMFYNECLESQWHCGPTGYPIGYGQFYCEKFIKDKSLFSPRGVTWMVDTMMCLQNSLVPLATHQVSDVTCTFIKETAFATHAPCYLKEGLCSLAPEDWLAILDIVQIKTLFSSWDAFKATVEATDGCADFYAWMIEHDLF